jgi:hypothetical protein
MSRPGRLPNMFGKRFSISARQARAVRSRESHSRTISHLNPRPLWPKPSCFVRRLCMSTYHFQRKKNCCGKPEHREDAVNKTYGTSRCIWCKNHQRSEGSWSDVILSAIIQNCRRERKGCDTRKRDCSHCDAGREPPRQQPRYNKQSCADWHSPKKCRKQYRHNVPVVA